jgi:hypothetical protein
MKTPGEQHLELPARAAQWPVLSERVEFRRVERRPSWSGMTTDLHICQLTLLYCPFPEDAQSTAKNSVNLCGTYG